MLRAKKAVSDDPFAILLSDDLIDGGETPCLSQMVSVYEETGKSVIAVESVEQDKTDQYGIVEVEDRYSKTSNIKKIIEKPKPEAAPSNLGVVGRYILSNKFFDLLQETGKGTGDEI